MTASSNFKASGFTEAVMQMDFWISHELVQLNTLSSSWHLCVYFWRVQAFRYISTASFTFNTYSFLIKKYGNRLKLGLPISFCANLYCNNHRITSLLLRLGTRRPSLKKYNVLELSCDYRVKVPRDFLVGASSPESAPYQVFGDMNLVNVGW